MGRLAPDDGERFRAVARTLPDGLFVVDTGGRIVFANDAVRSILGYDPESLIGRPATSLVPAAQRPADIEEVKRVLESGGGSGPWGRIELQALREDGTEVPVEVSWGTYERGGERFVTGVVRDITRRREREHRLRFQARLLDAVGEAVIATDLDGRILYWNAYAERLYGWRAEEVLGRQVTDVTPTELSRVSSAEIMDRLRQGDAWTGEFEVQDRSGREFPVLVTDSPVLDDDGRLVGIIGTSKEITERKRTEEAQRFLAEAGRVLAWSLDQATTLGRVSRMAIPLLGQWCMVQLREEGEPEPIPVEHCTPPGKEHRAAELEAALTGPTDLLSRVPPGATSARVSVDDPAFTDAGRETLRELGIRELMVVRLDVRDHPLGMMAFAREEGARPYDGEDAQLATELALRAAAAIENARLYRDAEESNRAKTDFLAVVSHELRTPLNAITGYTDLLSGEISGPLNEKQAAQLERIKVGARHLAHLIDEILSYARVESGRDTVEVGNVDLAKVAREAAIVLQPSAEEKGLDLAVDAPRSGPELRTDAGKIRQILVNLLSNAVKYTEEGEVRVTVRAEGDGAVLSVSDTGIGIPEEAHERIFEPFRQVQSPNTRTVGGTGLGLSVNRRLVDLLGGTISVESAPGDGSTFTVRLPARSPERSGRPMAETGT